MSVEMIVALLGAVENDDAVKSADFLTDGDDTEFPESLQALVQYLDDNSIDRADARELEAAGYPMIYADCLCIVTKKGVVNSGSDNL